METVSTLHMDVAKTNTNVMKYLDEKGSTGVKRSHITRSPIMQYFKLLHERTYLCKIYRQKYPDGMQGSSSVQQKGALMFSRSDLK